MYPEVMSVNGQDERDELDGMKLIDPAILGSTEMDVNPPSLITDDAGQCGIEAGEGANIKDTDLKEGEESPSAKVSLALSHLPISQAQMFDDSSFQILPSIFLQYIEANMKQQTKGAKRSAEEQDEKKKRARTVSMSNNEAVMPHIEFFKRPGKTDLRVFWDEYCAPADIPPDFEDRAMIRRIVSEVALERGHEIAMITECKFRGNIVEHNHGCGDEQRLFYYAEHIEVEFGYKKNLFSPALGKSDGLPFESATIYFGPDDECEGDNIRPWRKGGRAPVVWGQNEKLKLGHPRLV
ncbi:hypothetical protein VTL71DRAFT_4408 [Oculimacula yallundae]|uniref:Uncharacterized protein n=1 Tax=Oculimacula yallundae TaxID=86028 RepID=A0ABR4C1Y6_9HELO